MGQAKKQIADLTVPLNAPLHTPSAFDIPQHMEAKRLAAYDSLRDENKRLRAALEGIEDLWAFSVDHIEEQSEFDKRWFAKARSALARSS